MNFFRVISISFALPTPTRSSVKKLAFEGKWQIDCVSTSIAFRVSSICSIIWWIDFLKIDFLVLDMFFRNNSVRVVPYLLTWFALEDSKSSSRAWTLVEFRHLVFITSTDFLLFFRLFVSHVFPILWVVESKLFRQFASRVSAPCWELYSASFRLKLYLKYMYTNSLNNQPRYPEHTINAESQWLKTAKKLQQ